MVTNGQLIDAAEKYYASNIRTIEFDGRVTEGRQAAIKKLNDFVGSIQKVKEISLLRSASDNNASFSEYILSLEMKDGSEIMIDGRKVASMIVTITPGILTAGNTGVDLSQRRNGYQSHRCNICIPFHLHTKKTGMLHWKHSRRNG